MTTETYTHERASFVERIQRLGGSTTWREPMQGGGSKADSLPDAHALAAAMAWTGKADPGIGHRVAYAIYLGSKHWAEEIVAETERQLLELERRIRRRHGKASISRFAAIAAYMGVCQGVTVPEPAGSDTTWFLMVRVGERWLLSQAEEALDVAEAAYRRRA